MTRHSVRASVALRALNEADPAMAALALWCDHRDRTSGPAAETTGSTIHYGPAFDTLPRHEQIGLAAHHILHAALRHTVRMHQMAIRMGDAFDATLYNIAADAIVNEALLQSGYALPRPALTLTGLLAEALALPTPAREALADWDVDRLYIRLRQEGEGKTNPSDRARSHASARAFGRDLVPDPAPGTGKDSEDDATWRQHLARALDAGRIAGRGIGVLGHTLADIPAPTTPWEVILRRLVTRAVTQHPRPSHRRPARAWIAMEAEARRTGGPSPAFEPGLLRSTDTPRIAIALDTSSSIDDTRLALFMAEVTGIARRSVAEIHLILFDEAVQASLKLDPATWKAQIAALRFPRGGGTSFAPAIAKAARLRPSILVILTDLEGDPGPAPRGLPVIWAVPDALSPAAPPFGHLLSLAR